MRRVRVSGYDELKLRIEPRGEGVYRVMASGPAGEASGTFTLPFAPMEVENFVLRVGRTRGRRRVDTAASDAAKQFGGELFAAVFQGQVRDLYRAAGARSRGEGRGLRMTLCLSDTPELMDLPWEYLYDAPNFLATSAFTPVVRYLDLPSAQRPLKVELPLRILGVVSSPTDYEALDIDRERTNLEQALGGLLEQGIVEIEWLQRPSLASLLRTLQSGEFHILHFVGHGAFDEQAAQGVLLFQDETGYGQQVTGDSLGMLLRDFTSLRLAVLNACEGARTSRADPFAGVATALIERDIPAVIAMQFEITDRSAIAFAEGFYHALAGGAPVDQALSAARLAIFANSSRDIEWGTPVLFMRVGDGRIFELPDAPIPAPAPVVIAPEPIPAPQSSALAPPTRSPTPQPEPAPEPESRPAPALTPVTPEPAGAGGTPRRSSASPGGRRPPTLWLAAGAAAIVAAVVVVILVAGGGSHKAKSPVIANVGSSTTASSASASSSTPASGTSTASPVLSRSRHVIVFKSSASDTVGTFTLSVAYVRRTPTYVDLYLLGTNKGAGTVTLPFGGNFTADDNNKAIVRTMRKGSWPVYSGYPSTFPVVLRGASSRAKSVTIRFAHIEDSDSSDKGASALESSGMKITIALEQVPGS